MSAHKHPHITHDWLSFVATYLFGPMCLLGPNCHPPMTLPNNNTARRTIHPYTYPLGKCCWVYLLTQANEHYHGHNSEISLCEPSRTKTAGPAFFTKWCQEDTFLHRAVWYHLLYTVHESRRPVILQCPLHVHPHGFSNLFIIGCMFR